MLNLCQDLEERMGYLSGDCLMAAAFMSYMGPFLSNYRDELVQKKWIEEVFYFLQLKTNFKLEKWWYMQPNDIQILDKIFMFQIEMLFWFSIMG